MSEMSQSQNPLGATGSMDPTEDIVPGGAEGTDSDAGATDAPDSTESATDAPEPSEADMPGAAGAGGGLGGAVGSGGGESSSDPMPDIAGTGS